jgi:hypothetical protein
VARKQGNYKLAGTFSEESLALCRELQDAWNTALALNNLWDVAQDRGAYARAVTFYVERLLLHYKLGHQGSIATGLEGLAAVLCCWHRQEEGALLYGVATALREQSHTPVPPSDRTHAGFVDASARATLGKERFEMIMARGRSLTVDEAMTIIKNVSL